MPLSAEVPHEKKSASGGSVLRLNDDELALCAKSCVLLSRQIGIGSALTYLFGILSEHFPLTRIFCGFRRYKTSIFTPLADTLSDTHNRVRTLATTNFTQEQINLLMGSDSLRPYTINNAFMLKNVQTSLREEDLASYLRIPLFTVGPFSSSSVPTSPTPFPGNWWTSSCCSPHLSARVCAKTS